MDSKIEMNTWRLSKYDPRFRKRGAFQLDVWTSVSDIGKSFEGKVLTVEEYLRTENQYVSVISSFLKETQVSSLVVTALEKHFPDGPIERLDSSDPLLDPLAEITSILEGDTLSLSEIETVCRLSLREFLWCKLENDELAYVHFGYDYYVYLGSASDCPQTREYASSIGLFMERFPSPYL